MAQHVPIGCGILDRVRSTTKFLQLTLTPSDEVSGSPLHPEADLAIGKGALFAQPQFSENGARPIFIGSGTVSLQESVVVLTVETPEDTIDYRRTIELIERQVELYVLK